MNGPGVLHSWDGERRVGAAVQPFVEGLDYPAWNFWMLYRSGVTWGASEAPEPDRWEHQLSSLRRDVPARELDVQRFTGKALGFAGSSAETAEAGE